MRKKNNKLVPPKGNLKISNFFLNQPRQDDTQLQVCTQVIENVKIDTKSDESGSVSQGLFKRKEFYTAKGLLHCPEQNESKICKMNETTPVKQTNSFIIESSPNSSSKRRRLFDRTPDKLCTKSVTPNKVPASPSGKQKSLLNYLSPSRTGTKSNIFLDNALERHGFDDQTKSNIFKSDKEEVLHHFNDDCDDIFRNYVDIPLSIQKDRSNDNKFDLKSRTLCKIVSVCKTARRTKIILASYENPEQSDRAICYLCDFWRDSMLAVNDVVSIWDAKKNMDNETYGDACWIIDNEHGFVLVQPHQLVSCTSIVNSLFCKRKNVFQEHFKGWEPPNKFMVVGSLVHTLLQTVLLRKYSSRKDVESVANELLASPDLLRKLYDCEASLFAVKEELNEYIDHIVNFLAQYIHTKGHNAKKTKKHNWNGLILDIEDIEENFWCPSLGMKGKIDITVRTMSGTMPLELKTGRASDSMAHRGQVMMYLMMMSTFGYETSSGLLFYLKEEMMKEVSVGRKEQRDMILLRNELAYYLSRLPNVENIDKRPVELPETIDRSSVCEKCPYNNICSTYLRFESSTKKGQLNSFLAKSSNNAAISPDTANYFLHWSNLIHVEYNFMDPNTKTMSDIFMITDAKIRERNGRCLAFMQLTSCEHVPSTEVFEHTFQRSKHQESTISLLSSGIQDGNYIVISTDIRAAVATGFVSKITENCIKILIEKDILKKKYATSGIYHLDTYESRTSCSFALTSIALILDEESKQIERLRSFIVDRKPPSFKAKLPKEVARKGMSILKPLNQVQQRAILRSIAMEDYLLIQGMPGTGKTALIVALVELLYIMGKSVLITSHTHAAVDNICLKLVEHGVHLMRLGIENRFNDKIKQISESELTKHCKTLDDLEKVYTNVKVFAVTCMGSGHPVLHRRALDVCIVDESTQVLQPILIRPLSLAKSFILVGDPEQLAPVVRNRQARTAGMTETMFDRLKQSDNTIALSVNYRMNSAITALANYFTYDGNLQIGSEAIANATLNINHDDFINLNRGQWLQDVLLDSDVEHSIKFIDTGPVWMLRKDSLLKSKECTNIYEASIIYQIVRTLLECNISIDNIGIIATYMNQVGCITSTLKDVFPLPTVSTVDQFQGRDKQIIIYSCSLSKDMSKKSDKEHDILEDKRRLNVAITRAKHKLILIGDINTVNHYTPFQKILTGIEKRHILQLENYTDFRWNDIIDS